MRKANLSFKKAKKTKKQKNKLFVLQRKNNQLIILFSIISLSSCSSSWDLMNCNSFWSFMDSTQPRPKRPIRGLRPSRSAPLHLPHRPRSWQPHDLLLKSLRPIKHFDLITLIHRQNSDLSLPSGSLRRALGERRARFHRQSSHARSGQRVLQFDDRKHEIDLTQLE